MSTPTSYPGSSDDTGAGSDRGSTSGAPRYPGTPGWVKVSGIVVLVLVLPVVGIMVAGGGQHGPGRHMPAGVPGGAGGLTSPTAQGVQQAQQA